MMWMVHTVLTYAVDREIMVEYSLLDFDGVCIYSFWSPTEEDVDPFLNEGLYSKITFELSSLYP